MTKKWSGMCRSFRNIQPPFEFAQHRKSGVTRSGGKVVVRIGPPMYRNGDALQ